MFPFRVAIKLKTDRFSLTRIDKLFCKPDRIGLPEISDMSKFDNFLRFQLQDKSLNRLYRVVIKICRPGSPRKPTEVDFGE